MKFSENLPFEVHMSRIIRICLALVAGVMLATVIWAPASGLAQTVIVGNGETVVVEDPNSSPPPPEAAPPPAQEEPPPVTAEPPPIPAPEVTITDLGIVKGEEGAEKAPKSTTKPARTSPRPQRQGSQGYRPHKPGFGYTMRGKYSLVSFNQNSPVWASNPFCRLGGGRTMASSACGVTSLAMVGRTLTGRRSITPPGLARKYCSRIIRGGALSYFHGGGDLILTSLKDMGLKARRTGGNLNLVRRTVQRGGLAIVLFGPGRFTGGGHFLVIRAAKDGKLYFADAYGTGQFGYNNEAEGIPEAEVRANGLISTWTAER